MKVRFFCYELTTRQSLGLKGMRLYVARFCSAPGENFEAGEYHFPIANGGELEIPSLTPMFFEVGNYYDLEIMEAPPIPPPDLALAAGEPPAGGDPMPDLKVGDPAAVSDDTSP